MGEWSYLDGSERREEPKAMTGGMANVRAGEMGVAVELCESVAAEPEQVNPVKSVMTGKFRNANIGSPKHYISNKGWSDEICDECGKRFGAHFDTDCRSQ